MTTNRKPPLVVQHTRLQMHPGHDISVTEGVFGRGYLDCSCGLTRTCPSKRAAQTAGLRHHHDVADPPGSCNCPPAVVTHPDHPTPHERKAS